MVTLTQKYNLKFWNKLKINIRVIWPQDFGKMI
jgi:hypothetical protein